jgi:hypothetical protein
MCLLLLSEQEEGSHSHSVLKEFIQHRLVPDGYEHFNHEIMDTSNGPRKQNGDFLKKAPTILIKNCILFWDITPCSSLTINGRFGGNYRLHIQGRISPQDISKKIGGKRLYDLFLRNVG